MNDEPSVPAKLGAKEFEDLCLFRARQDEEAGLLTMGRYGVQVNRIGGEWQPVDSLPDFEGCLPNGRQFVFDCKVCSGPSLDLAGGSGRSFNARQYRHLIRRSRFGALTFLLVHFNARVLKRSEDPAQTVCIPVTHTSDLWQQYDRAEWKALSRNTSLLYGFAVGWDVGSKTGRGKATPNLGEALKRLSQVGG